jgi:hypothetical protein
MQKLLIHPIYVFSQNPPVVTGNFYIKYSAADIEIQYLFTQF